VPRARRAAADQTVRHRELARDHEDQCNGTFGLYEASNRCPGLRKNMTRLLSILVLVSLLAGFAAGGAPSAHAAGAQAVALSQGGGASGGSMAGGCSACPMMGACVAPGSAQSELPSASWLQSPQPSSHLADQTRAPDTAPPKRFSA